MSLRHNDKPAPRWLVFCAGPMLIVFSLVGASFAVFVQSQKSAVNAVLTIAACVLLTYGGIQLIREFTWPSIKKALRPRRDRTGRDAS